MLLAKFVVFVTLIGGQCLSKIAIEVNQPNDFSEIEEATIQLLTTCFSDRDKTIVLAGEFPGKLVERLTSNLSFSAVLLDDRRRAENNYKNRSSIDYNRRHMVHVIVMMAAFYTKNRKFARKSVHSQYENHKAYHLIIGWSNEKHERENRKVVDILYRANSKNIMNCNVLVHDSGKGIVLYSSNPFAKKAPKPWRIVRWWRNGKGSFHYWSYFVRKHVQNEKMCENLEFDREHNIGGAAVTVKFSFNDMRKVPKRGRKPGYGKNRRKKLILKKVRAPIYNFIRYVNGTGKYFNQVKNSETIPSNNTAIKAEELICRYIQPTYTAGYPHGTSCKFIVTQFRGNKTQLRKIYDIIDGYSWIGMYLVYLVTLIFFKYFLQVPLIAGLLNLCRLTCNCGLTRTPLSHWSRIYLGCLLFFVVTMQGIFTGNLAALLTHDIPVQQINSIQDVIDFDYTLSVMKEDLIYVDYPIHRGNLFFERHNHSRECIPFVMRDPQNPCLCWHEAVTVNALELGLYLSPGIGTEPVCRRLPHNWYLEGEFNKFMMNQFEADTVIPFDAMVDKKRLLEFEAREVPLEPRVMTMKNLGFAFVIVGCGLSFAFVTFVGEFIIDRHQRKVKKERETSFSLRGAEMATFPPASRA